jgi:hypothetical protein
MEYAAAWREDPPERPPRSTAADAAQRRAHQQSLAGNREGNRRAATTAIRVSPWIGGGRCSATEAARGGYSRRGCSQAGHDRHRTHHHRHKGRPRASRRRPRGAGSTDAPTRHGGPPPRPPPMSSRAQWHMRRMDVPWCRVSTSRSSWRSALSRARVASGLSNFGSTRRPYAVASFRTLGLSETARRGGDLWGAAADAEAMDDQRHAIARLAQAARRWQERERPGQRRREEPAVTQAVAVPRMLYMRRSVRGRCLRR